jgi:hypothetical protein
MALQPQHTEHQKLSVIVDAFESIRDGTDRMLISNSCGDKAKLGAKDEFKLDNFSPKRNI